MNDLVGTTLKSRTMMAFALCVLAQGEVEDGHVDCASETVRSVRRLIDDIRLLLNDSEDFPLSDIRGTIELLAELEDRARQIELAVRRRWH
jgi:hypothetical protein